MKFLTTDLPGVLIIEPDIYRDDRGLFFESYQQSKYTQGGLPETFVQDNHSRSMKDVLRGMHAQRSQPQGKLVRVMTGEVYDVIVDIRKGSPTFMRWIGITLSADNFRQCYVPPGFAHGFCVMSDKADVEYKVTDFYNSSDEIHLLWNDPDIGIKWPIKAPLLSPKDRDGLRLRDLEPQLPVYQPEK